MKKIIEVLRLKYAARLSHEKIARACGLSKGAVGKYVSATQALGITWPLPEGVDQARLEALLFPARQPSSRLVEPDLLPDASGTQAQGRDPAVAVGRVCRRARRVAAIATASTATVIGSGGIGRNAACARSIWPVTSCLSITADRRCRSSIATPARAARRRSSCPYSAPPAIPMPRRPTRSRCRTGSPRISVPWRFYGGVPALLVPDNLKSAIDLADRYEPGINATYAEMAAHYGTAVLPARPYKPKDKAKAEVAVQVVERWILARLRHHTFFSLAELNAAIKALLPALNERPFQGRTESRRDLFETIDRPALKPLPRDTYDYAEWRKAKPGIDYHIAVDKRFYSVPHNLVGQTLDVRLTRDHRRGPAQGAACRQPCPSRAGALHDTDRAYAQGASCTPRLVARALHSTGQSQSDPAPPRSSKQQLTDRPHPEHGYRSLPGAAQAQPAGTAKPRLEAACQRALAIHSASYRSVASILKQGLDQQPLPDDQTGQAELPLHTNVRGPGYYH